MKPVIAITLGDPAGVGPEVCLGALADARVRRACVPVVFGDAVVLRNVAARLRLPLDVPVVPVARFGKTGPVRACVADLARIGRIGDLRPGRVQRLAGQVAHASIVAAVQAVQAGHATAIATGPIHKEALRLAGVPYPGHTELLAALTRTRRFCMMMASPEIKVSLVTTHTGIASVAGNLSARRIRDVIELTADTLRRLGCGAKPIMVCALNPHGGEHGLFGQEERDIIEPAIRRTRRAGLRVEGPVAPDTAFLPDRRRRAGAYVVMYHDQGLIPFKMLAFEHGVNVTLGLPFVRTSVDHGTAFDIAWKGVASSESMVQSILWAVRLTRR